MELLKKLISSKTVPGNIDQKFLLKIIKPDSICMIFDPLEI